MASPFLPTVVVEVIAAVSGVIVSVGIPLLMTKLNKINKLYITVFGIQDIPSSSGLIQRVNNNEENLETAMDKIERNNEKLVDIDSKQDMILDKIN